MEPAEILALAIRLAPHEGSDDPGNEYWDLIRTLHRNPEQHVFGLAAACCLATSATQRAVGATVLAQLGDMDESTGRRPFTDQSTPILRALLQDPDVSVLTVAIHALAHHGIGAANALRDLARHNSADVRYAVAHALGRDKPGDDELRLMIDLTQDAADSVRDWATFALGSQCDADTSAIRDALRQRLGAAEVGAVIVRELDSDDRGVFGRGRGRVSHPVPR